jgi:hypothetical protein
MATLSPVIPVNDLLESIKKLETVTPTAPLAAEATSPPYTASSSHGDRPSAYRNHGSSGDTDAGRQSPSTPPPEPSGEKNWLGFVSHLKTIRPMLATKLETATPIKTAPGTLHIGYPKGSLELSMLQEADSHRQLTDLAAAFFGTPTTVKILSISPEGGTLPQSIAEKKTAERARQEQELKTAVDGHPLVIAALDIFGGEIIAYKR